MNKSFKTTSIIYKYLIIIFSIIYWIYIVIDDLVFIEKYGLTFQGFGIWFFYYLAFLLCVSIYFWVIITILIFIYHKIIKFKKKQSSTFDK
jgi:hypothetical protein